MISYRKLAMRVLGHPLRVPTNTPRPASHRVTALALTAAMVAGMAAPAYAGTYYIGDGNITITKDTDGKTYVKHSNSTDKVKGDEDDGEIIIKGGKRSDDTTASGGSSSNGTASAASPAQPKLTTPPSEDIENEDKDMVYLGGTKGSDSSDGSGEENETDSTEKDQTGGKNTGAGSSDPESTGAGSSDPESTGAGSSDPESTGSESGTSGSENGTSGSESGTTGSDDTIGSDGDGTKADDTPTTGGEKNDPQPGGSPAPESQFTYTGAPLKVADANDDEGTRNESTTVLERAADNFTKNVIRIINNFIGNSSSKADNTLNVTLDNVNITAKNDAALSVEGAGDTKITLRGSNTLTNDLLHAGLEHNEKSEDGSYTGKLTITSEKDADGNDTGSLTATGGNGAAGIGSSDGNGAGTIEITGGDITAIGGNNAAGIGSGYNSNGTTTIKIDGSTIVKAQGGSGGDNSGGAGIGSGDIGGGYTGSSTTNITISGGTIVEAVGGNTGDGIGSGSGNRSNSTTVTINGGRVEKAQGGKGYSIFDGGDGIHSDDDLTIPGNATIVSAIGGSGVGSSGAGNGIYSGGKLAIEGGTIGTAQGGNATADYKGGGHGIYSNKELTINSGTIGTAQGGEGQTTGGNGIYSKGDLSIEGGTIGTAQGDKGYSRYYDAGDGIRSDGILTIKGGTIGTAKGGDGGKGDGGKGIFGRTMKILAGTIGTAKGGNATASNKNGGSGIHSDGYLTISGNATITNATGGSSTDSYAGDGIHSGSVVKISGDTITKATGGNATGENSTGGSGIGGSFVNVTGGTISAAGGSGKSGGAGIDGDIVSIGNIDTPLNITATSPDADNAIQSRDGKKLDEIIHLEENGMLGLVKLVENGVTRLFHNGVYTKSIYPAISETHPLGEWRTTKEPTCTEKGERQRSCTVSGCVVTETEELPALGHQWSGWTPVEGGSREYRICTVCHAVEYRDVSHNSGDSTISTGLRVLDSTQADILQNAQLIRLSQINDVLYIDVALETASLQGVLSDLTGLRSENIETVVFSTERCTSTLSLSDVAALGAGDTPFTLSHSGSTASFIVGGADHSALLR